MDKCVFLNKYHRGVEIIKNNLEEIEVLPQSWRDILHAPSFGEKK